MTILARYLIIRVAPHLLLVTCIFAAVFVTYTLATYLSRAAAGLMQPDFVFQLVLVKSVIAMDVILPIALYTAVALALARLRRAGEVTGMLACGFGPAQVGAGLSVLFLLLAAAVGTVSLWGRPIAYASLYHLRSRAESAFDFSGIEAGRFYSDADGERVVFVDAVDGRRMNGVFIWMRGERRDFVIHADELVRQDGMDAESTLHVTGLHMYKRRRTGWFLDAEVGSVTTGVDLGKLAPVGTKRKAESTIGLMRSEEPEDVAELQWRLSRPLSALLLGFLALRCAGPGARFRSGFRGAVFVITACVLNELLFLAARNLVREGVVGAWPGLWWVHAGVLLYLLLPRIAPLKSRRGLKGFADG